ncbi:unnamed protein product [Trichobilharzia szidati]|nr:unnamed protein product [Trichobilharzia szidati]
MVMMRPAYSTFPSFSSSFPLIILFLLLSGIICYLYTGYTHDFISSIHFYSAICSLPLTVLLSLILKRLLASIQCSINFKLLCSPSSLLFLLCGVLLNTLLINQHDISNESLQAESTTEVSMFVGDLLTLTSGILCPVLMLMMNNNYFKHFNEGISLWFGFLFGSFFHIRYNNNNNNINAQSLSSSSSCLTLILFNISIVIHFVLLNEQRCALVSLSIVSLVGLLCNSIFNYLPDNRKNTSIDNDIPISRIHSNTIAFYILIHGFILLTYILICASYFITCPLFKRFKFTYHLYKHVSIRLYLCLSCVYIIIQLIFIITLMNSLTWDKFSTGLIYGVFICEWIIQHAICCLCLLRLGRIIQRSDRATHSIPLQHNGQNRVWASLGARYLALISKSNMIFSILITIIFIIIISVLYLSGSFKPVKSEFMPLLQLSFLMDCYLVSIFYHLSKTTGPSAIGYALCHQFSTFNSNHPSQETPIISSSTNSITNQLFSDKAPFMNSMLLIEKFFTYYSIQKYGCVYTSPGQVNKVDSITNPPADNDHTNNNPNAHLLPLPLSEQYLRGIGKFFRECLSDSDIRYDTYVLYYIGPDNNKGDWIFEANEIYLLNNEWLV